MPLYYFHLIDDGRRSADSVGSSFASFELAYLATHRAVQDMWWEIVRRGRDPRRCSFEITDAGERPLALVPFTEPLDNSMTRGAISDEPEVSGGLLPNLPAETSSAPATEAITFDRPGFASFLLAREALLRGRVPPTGPDDKAAGSAIE